MNKLTIEDIPQLLNSINMQLTRIADVLENKTLPKESPKLSAKEDSPGIKKMKEMLANINRN